MGRIGEGSMYFEVVGSVSAGGTAPSPTQTAVTESVIHATFIYITENWQYTEPVTTCEGIVHVH